MEDTIVVVVNSECIINTKYDHYYFFDNSLQYNSTYISFSVLENYNKCIFQKSTIENNTIFTQLIKRLNYNETDVTEELIMFESNNILKKIILKNESTEETKIFLMSDKFIENYSIFSQFFGETNEYYIELNQKKYYDLLSYFYNVKLGTLPLDSLEYIGINPTEYHGYISRSEEEFYTKEFELLENKDTELQNCFIYGIHKFLKYATNIQKILLCIYTTNSIKSILYPENKFPKCIEPNYNINFLDNNLSIKYENGEIQNIKFNMKIRVAFITKNPEIILVATSTQVFILAYQNNNFVNIDYYDGKVTELELKEIIRYSITSRYSRTYGYVYLITLGQHLVILKKNVWKGYYIDPKTNNNIDDTYVCSDLLDFFDRETEEYVGKYEEFFVQRLQKSDSSVL